MADEIEYTQIKDLDPVTSVKDSDIFILDDGGTEEKKASMSQIKENTINRVNEILNANYPTNTDMENAIADAKPKVSEIDDNIVEMKPDGLYVSEKNSGIVPSMTQAEYDAVTDKQDGRIREITDAEGSPIPFAILNDEMETASNVWSAQRIKEEIKEVYSTEETVIGEFLGKPLYRKGLVASATSITLTTSWTTISGITDIFMAMKTNIKYISGTKFFANVSSLILDRIEMTLPDGKFSIMSGTQTIVNDFVVFIEYTKITD